MIKKNKFCFQIFFASLILYWLLSATMANAGYDLGILKLILVSVGLFFYLITLTFTKFSKKEMVLFIILNVIVVLAFIFSGMANFGILTIVPIMFSLKNVTIKEAVRTMFWVLLIYYICFLVLCLFNIIPTSYYIKTDAFGIDYNMLKLGNQHGNSNFVIVFNILSTFLYGYYDRLKKIHFIFLFALVLLFYVLLSSRTGIILSLLTLFIFYYYKFIRKNKENSNNNVISFFVRNSYSIFYVTVFFIAAFLKNSFVYNFLNKLVSSRIAEINHYLIDVGFGLFPKKVNFDWICDNTQVKILVAYGLVFTILYLVVVNRSIKKLYEKNFNLEIILMVIYLLYSYSEVAFFKPMSDFTMLFLIYAFSTVKIKDEENL